jgi:hypothetical protein
LHQQWSGIQPLVMVWLQFAGCSVYNYETKNEVVYNKENLLNPWFVVERSKLTDLIIQLSEETIQNSYATKIRLKLDF